MTNAEYIKSMSTKELAIFMQRFNCCVCPAKTYVCNCSDKYAKCKKTILNWLEKEILE